MTVRTLRPRVPLDAAQKVLARSVPGLVERVARDVTRTYGPFLPFEEMVATGHFAVALAAQSFDASYGVPFSQWAFYRATEAILDAGRRERRHRVILRARRAAMRFLAVERRAADDPFQETTESLRGELDELAGGLMTAMLDALVDKRVDAEEEIQDRESFGRARGALERVMAELSKEDRELVELQFGEDVDLRRIAAARGVSYFKLWRAKQELLKKMRRRLEQLGVHGPVEAPRDALV